MIFLIFLFLLYSCSALEHKQEVFETLSDVNQKWFQKIANIPEIAMTLSYPPYSYHSKGAFEDYDSDVITLEDENRTSVIVARNKSCSDDLLQILFNYKSDWAKQILDSDGKLSSGLLRGGVIWPGHFEECNSAYAPKDKNGHGDFYGKYCVTSWAMDMGVKFSNVPLTVGICVPDSCSAQEIKSLGKNILHSLKRFPMLKKVSSVLNLTDVTCKLKENTMDSSSIAFLVIIFCFLSLTVIGSTVSIINHRKRLILDAVDPEVISKQDVEVESNPVILSSETTAINSSTKNYYSISPKSSETEEANSDRNVSTCNPELDTQNVGNIQWKKRADPVWQRLLMCFSAFDNGRKILNTETSEGQLMSIHGIRFLSLTWVIIGHTYITSIPVIGNKIDVLKKMDSFPFQALLQSPFSVDSFFLLSGFLLAYLFFKEADKKNGKINWLYFYVHRFWRLTPVYMVIVFFYLYVFKYLGSGPFWEDHYGDNARSSWWKYLLYINNFIPIHQMRVGWSWYLANDMQFYIISPLFLYPLWRWPFIGFSVLGTMLMGSWITTGVLSYTYDLIPMFVGATQVHDLAAYSTKMWESFDLIYDKPYCRIAPYIIGVILGFVLHKVNQRKKFLNWWQQTLGWATAAFFSLSVIYGLYHVEMSRTTSLFYNSLCRSSFSLGLAWLIFACETGHGGFIAKLLSWKAIIPLSRLTYCTYLVHPILIHGYYQAYQKAFFFTELVMVTNAMGFIVMSYGLAFLLSITFESPLMNLEKLVLRNRRK